MSNGVKWVLLAIWALSLMAAMLVYSQRQLTEFDPQMVLSQAAASADFDQRFTALLTARGVSPGSIVHLQNREGCYCNDLTEPHSRQLNALLGDNYQFTRLSLNNAPKLSALITTYPAVAIIDDNRRLRYLGPYATGYGCYTGATLVDFIAGTATNPAPLGAVVNSHAQGCFCQT